MDYRAGNGSAVGAEYGLGGIVDGKANISGLPGVVGTGGGAGYRGIADLAIVAAPNDLSLPAVGLMPIPKNKHTTKGEHNQRIPLSGGRYVLVAELVEDSKEHLFNCFFGHLFKPEEFFLMRRGNDADGAWQ